MAGFKSTVELTIEGRDDPITVTYTAVDLRRYEAQFNKSVLIEPMSMTMLTYLGWSAARRQGLLNGSYEKWKDFDEACTGVQSVPNEEETDAETRPTRKEVGDDSS